MVERAQFDCYSDGAVCAQRYLYFSTSNRDGRGRVRRGDDKIVRFDPSVFE